MRRRSLIAAGTALTLLGPMGCRGNPSSGGRMPSSLGTSSMATFGVGRFLIDLPDHFSMLVNSGVDLIFGRTQDHFKVTVKALRTTGSSPSFDVLLANRIASLKSRHHYRAESRSMFVSSRRVREDANSPVVVRSYSSARLIDAFSCEVFVERGGVVSLLSRDVFGTEAGNSLEAVESQLLGIAEHMREVDPAASSGRGLCLGKVLLDAGHDGEDVSISFRSKQWPDTRVSVSSRSLLSELDGGLLKRIHEQAPLLSRMGFRSKSLRRGSTTLGGAPAEEILETGQDHDKTVRAFLAEVVLRKPATLERPLLALDAKMGGQVESAYVEPSLSESDAVALWDLVRASVRARPGAV